MHSRLFACALLLASSSAFAQVEPSSAPAPMPVQNPSIVQSTPPVPVSVTRLTAGPAGAVAAPSGPTLWRNITMDMPVPQLRALYPQNANVTYKNDRTVLSDVPVIEGCEAKVNVMHEGGVVKEIVMRGEGSLAGRCSSKIIAALSGKYGEPLDKEKVHGTILHREGKNYVWSHDGVTLQFKKYTNGMFGGGGLLAASWEMRYSATSGAIDL